MKIYARLKFRELTDFVDEKGETRYRVRFLDEDDNKFMLFMNCETVKPYLKLKENDYVDVPMNLYRSKKSPKYNIWVD